MDEGPMSGAFISISFAGTMYWYLWPALMGGAAIALWLRTRIKGTLAMGVGLLVSGVFVAIAQNTPSSAIENYTGDPNKMFEAMKPVNQELLVALTLGIQAGFAVALLGFIVMCVQISKRWRMAGELR